MNRYTRSLRANPLRSLVHAVTWTLLALGALSMAFPLFRMLSGSLKTVAEIFAAPIVWFPANPNFESYTNVIKAAHIGRAFLNSLIVTLSTVVTAVLFSSLAGYAFAKFKSRGLDILFTIVLAIMMIPLTVILIPMYITAWELNLLDTHVGLMLPRLMNAFGIFLFRQMMANIPDELIDAARIDGASELRGAAGITRSVASIEAVDDLTVKITLNAPNPRYIQLSWAVRIHSSPPIVPEHIWADQDPTTFNNYDPEQGWPVFTGPYSLTSTSPEQVVYDRRDDWWGAETGFADLPAPRRVIIVTAGVDEVVAARIQNNEVDSVAALSANTLVTVQSRNPNVIGWTDESPYGYTDPCPFYLEFNTRTEPWDDPAMRAALSYVVDRDVVANVAFEGQGLAALFLFPAYTGLMNFLDSMSDAFAESAYHYDPDASAAILEGKGYSMQDGKWLDSDGNPIVIDFLMLGFNIGPSWGRSIQILSQQFEDGGFEVAVSDLDFGPYWERANQGHWGVRMAWSCGSITEPYRTLANFHSDLVMPVGETASRNFGRWDNPEFSALVDELGTMTPSDDGYFDLAREAMTLFLADVPAIGLQQQLRVNPFNATYWTGWPTAENNYVNPQSWWSTAAIIIHNLEQAG